MPARVIAEDPLGTRARSKGRYGSGYFESKLSDRCIPLARGTGYGYRPKGLCGASKRTANVDLRFAFTLVL